MLMKSDMIQSISEKSPKTRMIYGLLIIVDKFEPVFC